MIYREMGYIRGRRIIPDDLDLVQIDIVKKLYVQPEWSSLDSFDRSEKLMNIIYYAKKKIAEISNKPPEICSMLKKLIDLAIVAGRDDREIDTKINLLISMVELRFREGGTQLYENRLSFQQ